MVHRDDPIVDRKLAYHYQVTMHVHAHAGLIVRYWRQQKTILVILAYLRLIRPVARFCVGEVQSRSQPVV